MSPTAAAAVPRPTPETLPFWEGAQRGVLVIQRCGSCEKWIFHPRLRCPECGADDLRWTEASGRGQLWSYIIVERAEPGFVAPYVLGIIQLEEGPRMMGQVRGVEPTPAAIRIDMPVHVSFEEREDMAVPFWRVMGGDR